MRAVLAIAFALAFAVGSAALADSVSLGDPSDGKLEEGVALPWKGKGFAFVERTKKRGYRFSTRELSQLVVQTAKALREQFPGAVLALGNMSKEGGGNIPQSRSHNSGRDVDVAFFFTDEAGKPIRTDDLTTADAEGRAGSWRFDLRRNLALVLALVEQNSAPVEWIFAYEPLRRRLLERARAQKIDPAVYVRAATALKQPSDSARHDDHFHVRVYCSRDDTFKGCEGYGARWPWVDAPRRPPRPEAPKLALPDNDKHPASPPDPADDGVVDGAELLALQASGCDDPKLQLFQRIDKLVECVDDAAPLGHNARLLLARWTGLGKNSLGLKPKEARALWQRLWATHRSAFLPQPSR